jgi:sulfonate transport system ATP-binding protein
VVEGLSRAFDGRTVLAGVDLVIERGEVVALLGASGSGKTTLLRALAGFDRHATGRAAVPARRAIVFQDHRLLPWKPVWRNVLLGLKGAPKAAALAVLDEVGLRERADNWPSTLSGGEAQRVALARAFVRRPELLLLDEPFGALDALTRLRAQRLLAELCSQYAPSVLLVTHDVEEALLLADRVLVLRDGVVDAEIHVELARPRSPSTPRIVALRAELLDRLGVGLEV